MSKISTALRAAALGPAPLHRRPVIGDWLDELSEEWSTAHDYRCDGQWFSELKLSEQRMFLLFVAEAEE